MRWEDDRYKSLQQSYRSYARTMHVRLNTKASDAFRQSGKGSSAQELPYKLSKMILADYNLRVSLDGIPCADTHVDVDDNSNDHLQCSRSGFADWLVML